MTALRMIVTVPDGPHYRSDAIEQGARAAGYEPTRTVPSRWFAGDVLVAWNLHRNQSEYAAACRAAGGAVIVMENGYLGHDVNGHQMYAMARDGHNGSGRWHVPYFDESRAFIIDQLRRWKTQGNGEPTPIRYDRAGYTLVIGQRGIGSSSMRSPANWHRLVGAQWAARHWPQSPVRIREHPGQGVPLVSLAEDLAGAARVVQWSSACGVAALQAGIPVYFAAPHWIAARGAHAIGPELPDHRSRLEQLRALFEVSYAQFTLAEIAEGIPFNWSRYWN